MSELFFKNFELLADAPNGIQKLRELILQLAVQGKLVTQDPNDEPAFILLKKIKAEKEKLIKEGKLQRQKPLPLIDPDEVPYEFPKGWEWVRLAEVGITQTGTTPSTAKNEYYGTDYPFIKPADISSGDINYTNRGLSKLGIEAGRFVPARSVLMVSIGGSIGKVGMVDRDCSCNQQINYICTFGLVMPRFVYYTLKSPYFQNQVFSKAPSTTMPILSKGKWDLVPIPLLPHKEQIRIVAKVDEIMSLCDDLEQRQKKKHEIRIHLNDSTLDKLVNAHDSDELTHHWKRIGNNFDLLYDHPESIGKLRQAIFQLAVMGRLVPQDPNDEPASVLLKRIVAEKERLVAEGKIGKSQPLPPIDLGELPYNLPKGWEWVRWYQIAFQIGDVDHKMPVEQPTGVPYISPRDFTKDGGIDFSRAKRISRSDFETLRSKIQPQRGDIIFPRYGTIGVNRLVEVEHDFLASYSCAVIKNMHGWVDAKYSFYYSVSPLVHDLIERYTNKTTQANVGVKSIKNFVYPLPALSEQKRIVAKVDQLMALCDELEAKLKQSQSDSERLMESIVREMVAA